MGGGVKGMGGGRSGERIGKGRKGERRPGREGVVGPVGKV